MLTVADVLSDGGIFAGMRRDHLEIIAACARFTHFPADAAIFLQGQPAERFYIIRSGSVVLKPDVPRPGLGPDPDVASGRSAGLVVALPTVPLAV